MGFNKSNCNEILGRSLFDSDTTAIVFVDKEGIITNLNKAYERFTGKSEDELLGKNITDIIDNTRMHIVAKTGIAEFNQLQFSLGKTFISSRLPIYENGECVGAIGIVVFNDSKEINDILTLFEEQHKKIKQYEKELRLYSAGRFSFMDIIGASKALEKVKKEAYRAAKADIDVLIQGETGTGKDLFAHSIFNAGSRRQGPFITINCSAIAPSLVESELFGYEAGAFTGADRTGRKGKFELADKGAIFLDEIGDMPLSLQPKILRVLEEREITRVGGSKSIPLDIMVIAATNRNLTEMMKQGEFRADLFYRLSTFTITIPPLRLRKEDIPLLLNFFNKGISKTFNKPVKPISPESLRNLTDYDWPGNVRELYNVTKRAVINSEINDHELVFDSFINKKGHIMMPKSGPDSAVESANNSIAIGNGPSSTRLSLMEKDLIVKTLSETRGNKSKAAQLLGLNRCTLYRKMKRYNLE